MVEILDDRKEGSSFGELMFSWGSPFFIERELEVVRSLHRDRRAALELPWPQARKRLEAMTKSGTFAEHGIFAVILHPAINNAIPPVMIGDARRRLARLAIALRRYEFEHGKLPDSFDALTPK